MGCEPATFNTKSLKYLEVAAAHPYVRRRSFLMRNVLSLPLELERLADRAPPGREATVRNEALRQPESATWESPRIFLGMSRAVLVAKTVPAGWDAVQAGAALTRLLG